MTRQFNFDALKAANRLPSPSGTALKIMQLLQSDHFLIKDLTNIVKADPALSARILKFVNSTGVGTSRSIVNLNDAIVLVGMTTVKTFALSLSLLGSNSANRCEEFDYVSYWSLSLARAVGLMIMSKRERVISPEEAFTLGLLADIGRLAMASAWAEEYSDCISASYNESQLKFEEEKCFGVCHDKMSLLLLADWGFSGLFVDSVKQFQSDNTSNLLASQLSFAQQLAMYCLANEEQREKQLPNLVIQAQKHDLTRVEMLPFLEDMLMQWKEWGEIVDIKTDVPYSKLFFLKNALPAV